MAMVRSSTGCWTCRLRRKKCDEEWPVCQACHLRGLACENHETKPDWMDGGCRQAKHLAVIKKQVKISVRRRREAWLRTTQSSFKEKDLRPHGSSHSDNERSSSTVQKSSEDETLVGDPPYSVNHVETVFAQGRSQVECPPQLRYAIHSDSTEATLSPETSLSIELSYRGDLIFHYINKVFNAQFPAYTLLPYASGGWIFQSMLSSRLVSCATMSVSQLYLAVFSKKWDEVAAQTGTNPSPDTCYFDTLRQLRGDITQLMQDHNGGKRLELINISLAMIQLIYYEIWSGNKDHFALHMNASRLILNRTLEMLQDVSSWNSWTSPHHAQEREALAFLTSAFAWLDICAIVSFNNRDTFFDIDHILAHSDVRVAEVTGCQPWVLRVMVQVARLISWKRTQVEDETLDILVFAQKAYDLRKALDTGLADLSGVCQRLPLVFEHGNISYIAKCCEH
ncbi:hypothetical protein BP00DRAFT_449631 [Aspergillus indologenus CBS 114.80]|uniref:Zn(2)-C6 fungal-type domain-containing protein n=1 Tax=Aspergillus indologenus CBS 114.80 TaxID=1450541 RepID=A0A2V5HZD8_9EURO|nr:hypothetical protein BP00DRAFT_449631 [Aspergillus indologenus CBS 114.80]